MFNPSSTIQLVRLGVCLTAVACSASPATPTPQAPPAPPPAAPASVPAEPESAPALPSVSLAVPAGNQVAFHLHASGVQIYGCQAAASGFSWSLQAPEASLVGNDGRVIVRHFAGPTWESLEDGSKVSATKVEAFTDKPDAIPALLLKASTHEGKGRFTDVSYIQRLETSAGLAPTDGCDAEHTGTVSRVPYTATYYFYRASMAF